MTDASGDLIVPVWNWTLFMNGSAAPEFWICFDYQTYIWEVK